MCHDHWIRQVSTTDQDNALQIDTFEAASCERTYKETRSGATKERPELSRCLDAIRSGDTLLVWCLDRLGRSLKDLVEIILKLDAMEIGFRSLTEAINTTAAGGKLIFHIFGALAEFERSLIQERTRAALRAARARGRKGGRPKAMSDKYIEKAHTMLMGAKIKKTEVAVTLT